MLLLILPVSIFTHFYSITLHWTEILSLLITITFLLSLTALNHLQPLPIMANPASPTPPSSMIPRDAEAPFNKPSTGLIVRSADKVDFHVHQLVLTLASSYFEKQLNNLQPFADSDKSISSCAVTDRPILDVPEDALIVDFMLRCYYPIAIAIPSLKKLEDVRAVLDAAQKYDMGVVTWFAEDALWQFESKCPLDVLAISLRCDLYMKFVGILHTIMALPSFLSLETKELDSMSGFQYHGLIRLYERCVDSPDYRFSIQTRGIFDLLVKTRFKRAMHRPSPRNAPNEGDAPFDDRNADIVLRSSDKINFHVHKVILSIASPLFKDMFSIPQPGIIEVAEDAQTLDFLLYCIYPLPLPKSRLIINKIDIFLEAARKYDIKDAVNAAEDALLALIRVDAFHAFVLSVRCNVEHICGMAARRLLEIQPTRALPPKLLQYISARPYRKLLQYHQKCGKAASAVARSRGWFSDYLGVVSQHRSCDCFLPDEQGSGWFAHQEVWDYLKKAEETLLHSPLSASVLSPPKPFDVSCEKCGRRSYGREFCQALKSAVEKATAEKKIEIPKFR